MRPDFVFLEKLNPVSWIYTPSPNMFWLFLKCHAKLTRRPVVESDYHCFLGKLSQIRLWYQKKLGLNTSSNIYKQEGITQIFKSSKYKFLICKELLIVSISKNVLIAKCDKPCKMLSAVPGTKGMFNICQCYQCYLFIFFLRKRGFLLHISQDCCED